MVQSRNSQSPGLLKTVWEGHYLDGQSSAHQGASIHVLPGGLQISIEGGTKVWWPYGEVRRTQGGYEGEQVRLEKGGDVLETLVVEDRAFLSALYRFAPHLGQFHGNAGRKRHRQLTALAALGVVVIVGALYLWGIPAMAAYVAPRLPIAWEEHLGESVVEQLAPEARRCSSPDGMKAINAIISVLTASSPVSPYRFRVFVLNDPNVNAWAAPGGYIIVLRGLLERTKTSEELAGVLAHELQHILQHHATRALLEDASTGLLLTAMTGDLSGAMAFGAEGARKLAMLRYSRQYEESADAEGLKMLIAARIDPAGMISFYNVLMATTPDTPGFLSYLSTHPNTADRIDRIRSLSASFAGKTVDLLPEVRWERVKMMCRRNGVRLEFSE